MSGGGVLDIEKICQDLLLAVDVKRRDCAQKIETLQAEIIRLEGVVRGIQYVYEGIGDAAGAAGLGAGTGAATSNSDEPPVRPEEIGTSGAEEGSDGQRENR